MVERRVFIGADGASSPDDYALGPTSGNQTDLASGSSTDITDLTITFDVGDTPKWVVLIVPWAQPTALASGHAKCQAQITDEADVMKAVTPFGSTSLSISSGPPPVIEEITTPGTYTRKGRFVVPATSGTWQLFHGAAFRCRLYSSDRPPFGV